MSSRDLDEHPPKLLWQGQQQAPGSSLILPCAPPRHCGPSSSTSPRTSMNSWSMLETSSMLTRRSSLTWAKAGWSGSHIGRAAGDFFLKTTLRGPTSQTRGLSTGKLGFCFTSAAFAAGELWQSSFSPWAVGCQEGAEGSIGRAEWGPGGLGGIQRLLKDKR